MAAACPNDPLRPVFEVWAAIAWCLALDGGLAVAIVAESPSSGLWMAAAALAMLCLRGHAAWRRFAFQRRLGGASALDRVARTLGRLGERHGAAVLIAPPATRAGLARLLAAQFGAQGDAVIVLDAAGEPRLESGLREAALALDAPQRFASFRPACGDGFRFDALANWDRASRIASRLRALLPGLNDGLLNEVASTVSRIAGALASVGRCRSIAGLRNALQSRAHAEALALELLERFFERRGGLGALGRWPPGRAEEARASRASAGAMPGISDARLAAAVVRFRSHVPAGEQPREIAGMIAMLEGPRLERAIAALAPLLRRLDVAALGPLLSPDPDAADSRPILNARALIESRAIVYFELGGSGEATRAAANLVLADIASASAQVRDRRIHVVLNEWSLSARDLVSRIAPRARDRGLVLHLFGPAACGLAIGSKGARRWRRMRCGEHHAIVGAMPVVVEAAP